MTELTRHLKQFIDENDNSKLPLKDILAFGKKELSNLSEKECYHYLHDAFFTLKGNNDISLPTTNPFIEPISQLPFYIINTGKNQSEYRALERQKWNEIRDHVHWIDKLALFDEDRFFTKKQHTIAL